MCSSDLINQAVSTFKGSCTAVVTNINTQISERNAQIESVSSTAANASAQLQTSIDALNAQLAQANASGNTELASQLQASIATLTEAQTQTGNLSSSLQPLASVTNEGSALSLIHISSLSPHGSMQEYGVLQVLIMAPQTHNTFHRQILPPDPLQWKSIFPFSS